ncbi:MAG: aminotransferase class III-fold pyridoxal phosphate-dependent enzyme, partial [Nitrospirae bacterium]|nr:aminotransferase class III-fold pyridoxal phosphate-dependent enzyme [Nitrospirota bacterium]
ATLDAILDDGFILDRCKRMGEYLIERLKRLMSYYPERIIDIRGKGLFAAMEINIDGSDIVKACLEKGVLINCTAGNVLRFTPPLIVEEKDIDHMVDILDEVMSR